MLIDTDVLIWVQRGNARAAELIENLESRAVSVQTYMELLQCAENKEQHRIIQRFIQDLDIKVLPLTENIGHRALIYVEEFTLSNGLRAGDAIIAATAMENGLTLCTANEKHFRVIPDLELLLFKPKP